MCVYVRDEAAFFDSSEIQQLNIGTIITPGHLIPSDIQLTGNVIVHNYVQLTVSVSPEMCKALMTNFLLLFQPSLPRKRFLQICIPILQCPRWVLCATNNWNVCFPTASSKPNCDGNDFLRHVSDWKHQKCDKISSLHEGNKDLERQWRLWSASQPTFCCLSILHK